MIILWQIQYLKKKATCEDIFNSPMAVDIYRGRIPMASNCFLHQLVHFLGPEHIVTHPDKAPV
jgi:hypothetical protein